MKQKLLTKILFLDFDGVLNDSIRIQILKEWKGIKWGCDWIRPELVKILNRIISETEAKIVVSSSWRGKFNKEQLQEILNEQGFIGEVIGTTKILSERNIFKDEVPLKFYDRSDEILLWIEENNLNGNWAVLDDIWDGFKNQKDNKEFMKNLVITNSYTGIKEDIAEIAIGALNRPRD